MYLEAAWPKEPTPNSSIKVCPIFFFFFFLSIKGPKINYKDTSQKICITNYPRIRAKSLYQLHLTINHVILPCHLLYPCLKLHPLCVSALPQHICILGENYSDAPGEKKEKENIGEESKRKPSTGISNIRKSR